MANTMAAGNLSMQGARASAVMFDVDFVISE